MNDKANRHSLRLFVVFELPDEVKMLCRNLVDQLREATGITWVRADKFHMTVAFLGDQSIERTESIKRWIGGIARPAGPLIFDTQGIVAFPNWQDPRVIVLGCRSKYSTAAQALVTTVENDLRQMGVNIERRHWRPHITLGRNQNGHYEDPRLTLETCEFTVRKISLFESVREDNGYSYRSLASFDL